MRLDQALVARHLCESRTEAQELISKGVVLVNGTVSTKQTKNTDESDMVELIGRRRYVSRGGEKLEGVLVHIFETKEKAKEVFTGSHALDVGSSTGGFTDCLLQFGVSQVDAVDVGSEQLHHSLRNLAQVNVHENTDIRSFISDATYDVIVADLSFIQLEQVLDSMIKHGHPGTLCFFLIKPQFEVGKGNTKKGIVKDEQLVTTVLDSYRKLAGEKGMDEIAVLPCIIQGGDGNQEYFLYGKMR